MKTRVYSFTKVVVTLIGLAAILVTGCDKKSNDSAVTYRLENGLCINNSNVPVALANCNAVGVNGFSYNASGQCIQTSTGQAYPVTYCQQSTLGLTGDYYISGTNCIQRSTGQLALAQFCQTASLTTDYALYNNQCYQKSTGVLVAYQLCQVTGTSTDFVYYNGVCYQRSTMTQYPAQYCQTATSGSVQCIGLYYYFNQGYNCGTQVNCSGLTMTNSQGQTVQCL